MDNGGYVEDQTLKDKLFNTEGRLNRMRYFKRCLLLFVITLLCYLVVGVALSDDYGNMTSSAEVGVLVVGIIGCFAGYCLNLRRMQDIGSVNAKKIALAILVIDVLICFDISEILAGVLGLLSLPVCLYMLFCPGTVGANEYGPDPLGPQLTSDVGDSGSATDASGDMLDIPVNNFNASSSNNNLLNNIQSPNIPTNTNETYNAEEAGSEGNVANVGEEHEIIAYEENTEETTEKDDNDDNDDDDNGFNLTDLF